MPEETHLYRKPKNPEACIRDPRSRQKLPAFGGRVPNNRYWRARTSDGDVVETTAQEIAAAKAPTQTNSKPASKAKKEG